jgi:hypothetical protein
MKKKIKVWKDVKITIERVVEQTVEGGVTDNNTLYYLINAKYSDGRGVGFRADTPIDVWSKLMHEVFLG